MLGIRTKKLITIILTVLAAVIFTILSAYISSLPVMRARHHSGLDIPYTADIVHYKNDGGVFGGSIEIVVLLTAEQTEEIFHEWKERGYGETPRIAVTAPVSPRINYVEFFGDAHMEPSDNVIVWEMDSKEETTTVMLNLSNNKIIIWYFFI